MAYLTAKSLVELPVLALQTLVCMGVQAQALVKFGVDFRELFTLSYALSFSI